MKIMFFLIGVGCLCLLLSISLKLNDIIEHNTQTVDFLSDIQAEIGR